MQQKLNERKALYLCTVLFQIAENPLSEEEQLGVENAYFEMTLRKLIGADGAVDGVFGRSVFANWEIRQDNFVRVIQSVLRLSIELYYEWEEANRGNNIHISTCCDVGSFYRGKYEFGNQVFSTHLGAKAELCRQFSAQPMVHASANAFIGPSIASLLKANEFGDFMHEFAVTLGQVRHVINGLEIVSMTGRTPHEAP